MKRALAVICAAAALCALPGEARAQGRSHWGVSGSLVPHWTFPEALADVWNMETDMTGTELRVGIVRGSDPGGDWGVSFVKKLVADGSMVNLREQSCIQLPGGATECARGAYHVTRDAGMTGVEAHVFIPFGTIRGRVQIGGTFAAGVARFDGTSDRFLEHLALSGGTVTRITDALGTVPFRETLQDLPRDWRVIPIGRVDLGVAVLARPGLKIRGSTGVNFPGFHVIAVDVLYFPGAR